MHMIFCIYMYKGQNKVFEYNYVLLFYLYWFLNCFILENYIIMQQNGRNRMKFFMCVVNLCIMFYPDFRLVFKQD